MPRSIAFVPTSADGSAATLDIDEIPADVKAEVEEVYAALKANPNGRMKATFDTKAELDTYRTQVISYCVQRTVDGVAAPLRFRKSPTKNLPETVMEFRIGDIPAEKPAPAAETPAEAPATETPAKAPKAGKK